jgi:hypothetical protein
MELYSPNRKNVQCFKKNMIKKKGNDDIMINRVQKNEIIFEVKKNQKKESTNDNSFIERFSVNLKNLFYNRVRTFFDYEDSDLNSKSKSYRSDCK